MLFMFTKQVIQHTIWSRQRDKGFPFASRSVPVDFSVGPRSSLVRYSLVYRRPIENRTRNKQKTNERATNVDRDADEKLSATRRFATVMAGRIPFCNPKTAYCPLPYFFRGRKQHFQPHLGHSHGESSLFHPFCTFHPPRKPLTGFKNISPPYCPTTTKDTPYPS